MIPVKEILLSPGDFFDKLSKKPESLKTPVVIILILGLFSGIAAAIEASASSAILPPDAAFMSGILPAIGFIAGVIMAFIGWIIWGGILYGLSSVLKGNGSFTRSLEIVGYGSIPQIFGGIISSFLVYFHYSSLNLTPITSQADMETLTAMMSSGPLMQAVALISIILFIWSANIWLFGILKCKDMELKKAVIAVGIMIIAYLLLATMKFI